MHYGFGPWDVDRMTEDEFEMYVLGVKAIAAANKPEASQRGE